MTDDQAPPKKKKGKLLLIVIILLLLGGGGAGAWFFFIKDMGFGSDDVSTGQASKAPLPVNKTIINLPEFRVNLSDPLGRRFIKLVLAVEVKNPQAAEDLSLLEAPIRDSIIMLLSSKTFADIERGDGKLVLKSEIADRINQILGSQKVVQVFIVDMIVQ